MLQEVLVSPTAKLDISSLLKSSPSPSPPPQTTSSRPSISRSFSISATDPDPRLGASPATSTASNLQASTAPSQPFNAPRQPSTGDKSALSLPATSSKRTASTSPLESRQPSKKTTRQWSKEDSEELVRLRFTGMKWEDVAARFHNRSATACRLRFQNYLERKHTWTEEQKRTLAQLYNRYKEKMWHDIALELGIPIRAVEDMHWDLGRERMASLAGVTTLHRASGDQASSSTSPMTSVFPPGGQAMTQASFMATPTASYSGPPTTPGRRLAQIPAPAATNGPSGPGIISGSDAAGLAPRRWNAPELRSGSSRGSLLPSMAEFERSVQAYAPPSRGRHRDGDDEEEDDEEDEGKDEEEDDDGLDEQWEKVNMDRK